MVLLLRFETTLSLFLAFTVFTSIVYFFWQFPFKPPPQKIRPEGTPALKGLALLRNAVAPSGLHPFGTDFWGGGVKMGCFQSLRYLQYIYNTIDSKYLVDNVA